jgi:hypothetical protein
MKTNKLQKLLGRKLLFASLLGISAGAFGSSKKRFLGTMASMVLFTGIAFAEVKMPEIFGDKSLTKDIWTSLQHSSRVEQTFPLDCRHPDISNNDVFKLNRVIS